MSVQENLQPKLRQKANEVLRGLSPLERETLLIKCWVSHDARWYMAVARECGMQVVNRLNQIAAHEIGRVEVQRVARALGLPSVATVDECLLMQEVLLGLFGSDLIDYHVIRLGDDSYQIHVQRCFAKENAVRAGIAEDYECGVFARVTGWLEALGLEYEMTPSLGKCLKVEGRECIHSFSLAVDSSAGVAARDH